MANKEAYPLQWPVGWDRTKSHRSSQFKTTLQGALKNVEDALRRFTKDTGKPVQGVVISSNYTLGNTKPRDGGVAIYFQWDERDACIAVDRYAKLQDNLQAIYHVIEAERTKLRHGGLNIVRQSFRGYTALPPSGDRRPWREILDLTGKNVDITVAEGRFKALAKKSHPDVTGGDDSRMADLNRAIDDARQELSN